MPNKSVLGLLNTILTGASVDDALTTLARVLDDQVEGMLSSIWLMEPDGERMRIVAAPNLPGSCLTAIDGLNMGMEGTSLGKAVRRGETAYVADISMDPFCLEFRDVTMSHGLKACWSVPILSRRKAVQGMFLMFFRTARTPTPTEIGVIENASHIAEIVIERERSQSALNIEFEEIKQSEAQLRQIINAIPHCIVLLTAEGNPLYANEYVREYTGISIEEVQKGSLLGVHPDDLERAKSVRQQGLRLGTPFELELRLRSKDGLYRWQVVHYQPLNDEEGRIFRWCASGTDIEDRKREEARLREENLVLREEIRSDFGEIIGESPTLKTALDLVSVVAPTDSSVLILGETGTGKELIARAIHNLSNRRDRAFVKLNCAAIPLGLLESELFGHEKGAFTGAIAQKVGRFELANKGTLFLDEVGDIPLELQAKLLRVLQEQEFERLGSNFTHKVDVRLIAATHRDLTAMVKQGTFREDLYYRLKVFPINSPALRQRPEDIPKLVWHFTARYSQRMNKRIDQIPSETMEALVRYRWPGNVRELQNFIERAVILSPHSVLRAPISELEAFSAPKGTNVPMMDLEELERDRIIRVLEASHWVVGGRNGAAARLGMKRTSLAYKMRKFQISRPNATPQNGTAK